MRAKAAVSSLRTGGAAGAQVRARDAFFVEGLAPAVCPSPPPSSSVSPSSAATLTLSPAEVLAGIAFLERYAPEGWGPELERCNRALVALLEEDKRSFRRAAPLAELDLCVRAEDCLRRVLDDCGHERPVPARQPALAVPSDMTIGHVETFMKQHSDAALQARYGRRFFTKIVLRDIRGQLAGLGLNY